MPASLIELPPQKNEKTIELLRDALDRAESGQIVEVVLGSVDAAGKVGHAFSGDSYARLVGAAEVAKTRLVEALLED